MLFAWSEPATTRLLEGMWISLPAFIVLAVIFLIEFIVRPPDFVIGDPKNPYLLRWWIIPRNRWLNVYLHQILRSDDDRALHDHPWMSLSIILAGAYTEVTPRGRRRWAGWICLRKAAQAHRLEVEGKGPTWSLFITGPVEREWGFHCPKGWVHWRKFAAPGDKGQVGKGCEQD